MKRLLLFSMLVLCVSCANGGLNKPLTQELTAEELRHNLKKNPAFEYNYRTYRAVAKWILSDNLLNAKYGAITYKQAEEYSNHLLNEEDIRQEHKKMFPNVDDLRSKARARLDYYKSIQPDSLVSLTFVRKKTEEGWLGNITTFYIQAVPLKGAVQQFDYEYYFSKKINSWSFADVPSSLRRYGSYSRPISTRTVIQDYGDWAGEVLEDVSTEEIKRDYDFLYKITNVRYKGKNWSDIPYSIKWALEKEEYTENDLDEVITKELEPNYISLSQYYTDKWQQECRKLFPTVASMFEAFWNTDKAYTYFE